MLTDGLLFAQNENKCSAQQGAYFHLLGMTPNDGLDKLPNIFTTEKTRWKI